MDLFEISVERPTSNVQLAWRTSAQPPYNAGLDTVPYSACGMQFCDDHTGQKWIQCQTCYDWFHMACQGLDENYADDEFACISCEWHDKSFFFDFVVKVLLLLLCV